MFKVNKKGVLIVNFEHISRLVLMFLLFEGINAGWVSTNQKRFYNYVSN